MFKQEKAIRESFFLMRTVEQWNRFLTEPVKFLFVLRGFQVTTGQSHEQAGLIP